MISLGDRGQFTPDSSSANLFAHNIRVTGTMPTTLDLNNKLYFRLVLETLLSLQVPWSDRLVL